MQKPGEDLCSHAELQGTNQNKFPYRKIKCKSVELKEHAGKNLICLSALKIQKA